MLTPRLLVAPVALLLGAATVFAVPAATAAPIPAGVFADGSSPQATVAVPAQVPPDPSTRITFFVGLPYDSAGLAKQAKAVSDPHSATFRSFLTPKQIAKQFGASTKAEKALSAAAKSLGLTSSIDSTRLFARVTGTVAAWEKAMGSPVQYITAQTSLFLGGPANDNYTFSPTPQLTVIAGVPVPAPTPAGTPAVSPTPRALAKVTTWFIPSYSKYIPEADVQASQAKSSIRSRAKKLDIDGFTFVDDGTTPLNPLPANAGTPLGTSCVTTNGTPVQGLSGPATQGDFYTPDQVSQAYGIGGLQKDYGAKASGDVTIISLNGGFLYSDVQNSANCFGHHAPKIDITLGTGVDHQFVNVDGETSLDVQTVAWTLKNAGSIRLVQVTNGPTSYLDGYSTALNDPKGVPSAITLSYGECDVSAFDTPGQRTTEGLFQTAALAGSSLLVASGDLGSSMCQLGEYFGVITIAVSIIEHLGEDNVPAEVLAYLKDLVAQTLGARAFAQPTVGYPASSPWVTAVGATQLTLGKDNQIVSQAVWNDLQYFGPLGNMVSTGGSSTTFAAPWYQRPLTSSDRRIVPDVTVLGAASPGMAISVNGTLQVAGGTSQSSPMMASVMALIASAGNGHLGFLNPWLYDLGSSQKSAFLDVTRGDNQYPIPVNQTTTNVPACCQAEPGFEAATGLGSPNFGVLVRAVRH